jgi:hypothetical protein
MPIRFPEYASRWFGIADVPAPPPPELWVQRLADVATTTGVAITMMATLAYKSFKRRHQTRHTPINKSTPWATISRMEAHIVETEAILAKLAKDINAAVYPTTRAILEGTKEEIKRDLGKQRKKLVLKKAKWAKQEVRMSMKRKKLRWNRVTKAQRVLGGRVGPRNDGVGRLDTSCEAPEMTLIFFEHAH